MPRELKTSLADLEDRVRRLYGAAGEIGATFTPDAQPFVYAGDLTAPGLSTFRGRRFSYNVSRNAVVYGVSNSWQIKAAVPVIIENVVCTAFCTVAGRKIVFRAMSSTDAALASVYGFQQANWKENVTSFGQSNAAPFATDDDAGVAHFVNAGFTVASMALTNSVAAMIPVTLPLDVYIPEGGGFGWYFLGATTITCEITVNGRIA